MKIRKCLDEEIPELDSAVTLSVYTKAPFKWILIDTETLDVYKGSNNSEIGKQWTKINKISNAKAFKKNVLK
jgi:hypothetical protein